MENLRRSRQDKISGHFSPQAGFTKKESHSRPVEIHTLASSVLARRTHADIAPILGRAERVGRVGHGWLRSNQAYSSEPPYREQSMGRRCSADQMEECVAEWSGRVFHIAGSHSALLPCISILHPPLPALIHMLSSYCTPIVHIVLTMYADHDTVNVSKFAV